MKKWKVINSTIDYKNKYYEVTKERIIKNDNGETDYYTIKKPSAAVIAAFTKENKLVMIRQYRHPVRTVDIELPAGYLNEGESAEDAAKREFLEETGYELESIHPLGDAYASAGFTNNSVYFFIGYGAHKTSDQNLDQNEEIEVFESSLEEAKKFIENNEMKDMGSVLGVFWAEKYNSTSLKDKVKPRN